MNYLDLFSGVGGFRLGLQRAGVEFEKEYHSEIDKYARSIYEKQFPKSVGLGDITKIKPETLDKIDLITFGFPCQDLSIAGKRKGLEGGRSGLFYEALRLIEYLKPDTFIFENVKGLYSSNNGADFTAVLRAIADLGIYECEWQLLNTKWFLPQNRERVYFIGHLAGKGGQKVFPITESDGISKESQRGKDGECEICSTVTSNLHKGVHNGGETYIKVVGNYGKSEFGQARKIYDKDGIGPALPAAMGLGGGFTPAVEISPLIMRDGRDNRSCLRSGRTPEIGFKGNSIRRLTPTECERLQGFPDGWTYIVSDSQRYKCLGNAVSVPVVECIARRLFK